MENSSSDWPNLAGARHFETLPSLRLATIARRVVSFVIAAVQIAGVARESFRAVSRANEEHGRVCGISITVAIAGCGAHSYYGREQRR